MSDRPPEEVPGIRPTLGAEYGGGRVMRRWLTEHLAERF